MSLCITCASIDILNIPKLPPSFSSYSVSNKSPFLIRALNRTRLSQTPANPNQDPDEPLGIPFHQSLDELNTAAEECAICKVVQQDVIAFHAAYAENQDEQRLSKGPDWKMWLAKGVNDVSGFMVVSADVEKDYVTWVLSAVGLCVEDEDPLSDVVAGRKIEVDPSSEITIQRARNWIRQCDAEHAVTGCIAADTTLPSKILDVNSTSSGGVSLLSSSGQVGKYAALTHAWDIDDPNPSINLDTNNISPSSLSQIFQDAITLTRALGLRYLWIPNLCIPPSSLPATRSTSNYTSAFQNAHITLSSLGSPTLFAPRTPPPYTPFPYLKTTLSAFSLPREPTLYPSNDRILTPEPLSQHPWAVQDRLFSRRILHFGTTQIYFECGAQFCAEDGFRMRGCKDTVDSVDWNMVLSLYRERPVPRASDKLLALSNVAGVLAARARDTYVAGLWRSSLVADMIWQATGHALGRTRDSDAYRGPSWSWACIDGPFGMFSPGRGADDVEWVELGTIQDVYVALRGEDPYGEVVDAWVKVRAPREALTVCEGVQHAQGWKMKTAVGSETGAYCVFDTRARAERAKGLRLEMLLLMKDKRPRSQTWAYHGIVVAGVEGREGVYERMGKVVFGEEALGECEWMKDEEKLEEVTLV